MSINLTAFFTFLLAYQVTIAEADMYTNDIDSVDFDELVTKYVRNWAKTYSYDINWFDIYGTSKNIKEQPMYEGYKVNVAIHPVEWKFKPRNTKFSPFQFIQYVQNFMDTPVTNIFEKEWYVVNNYIWGLTNKVTCSGFPSTFKVGTPESLTVPLLVKGFKVSMKTKSREPTYLSVDDIVPYRVNNNIEVPTMTMVAINATINRKACKYTWKADVYFDGYITVNFTSSSNSTFLRPIPITEMQDDNFVREEEKLKATFTGYFECITGTFANVSVDYYDVQQSLSLPELPTDESGLFV